MSLSRFRFKSLITNTSRCHSKIPLVVGGGNAGTGSRRSAVLTTAITQHEWCNITIRNSYSAAATTDSVGNNITYSGGQPTKGQGGFYGSGGARASIPTSSSSEVESVTDKQRSQMLALATDVDHIKMVMDELELLEHLLHKDQEEHNDQVTNRSVELRGSINHLVTNKDFVECLDRLEYQGKPIWGLSSEEHDLILIARGKINQC